jgi:hypothetical protein
MLECLAMSVWNKLPLLEAFWRLWDEVFPESVLNRVYDEHRGRCYQKDFSFDQLVYLLHDAMTQHDGRAKATLDRHQSQLPASIQAFYGKVRRMPVAVSQALLSTGAGRLQSWLPESSWAVLPECFREHRLLIFDGKIFKNASKRLKATRGLAGAALGGKALAVLDYATGLILGMEAHGDGHRNEQQLVQPMLEQLRPNLPDRRVWVADQHFGNLANFAKCTQHDDHAILRKHPHTVFTADSARAPQTGVDRHRRRYRDEVGTLSSHRHGTQPARQITLQRPGKDDLVIITSLLDRQAYPATAILDVYGWRWSIEETFQKVVDVFQLKRLIGSHPLAMIFQASLSLTLYNVMTVLRALLAQTQSCTPENVSMHQVNYDLKRQLTTSHLLLTPEEFLASLPHRDPSLRQRRARVTQLLKKAWLPRYPKAPNNKRHLPRSKHSRGQPAHFSIDKILRKGTTKDV